MAQSEKAKLKNDEISATSVRGCLIKMAIAAPIVGFLCIAILIIFGPSWNTYYRHQFYPEQNKPLIQGTVRQQCSLPDYEANGTFDESSLGRYFDGYHNSLMAFSIFCSKESTGWECTCEERESD